MADEKVLHPETIPDLPLPGQEDEGDFSSSQSTSGETVGTTKIKDQRVPKRLIAHETIGSALNTRSRKILAEFEFTQHGAIQIGKYTNGVSGDIRITPNGITARDKVGLITFALDGTSGDAIFKGTVQAGSIISESTIIGESVLTGKIDVGVGNIVIDGDNKQILVNDGTDDRILIGFQSGGF